MFKLFSGFSGLCQSKKATLCLIILICSTIALLLSKMDGMSYAAIVSSITLIYNYTTHKTDIASIQANANPDFITKIRESIKADQ